MNTPITIRKLISEENCYETLRQLRWPEGVRCPFCGSVEVNRRGYAEVHRRCRRYQCKGCDRRFDDLSETVLAGHHQPLPVWIVCLYFMGLNPSDYPQFTRYWHIPLFRPRGRGRIPGPVASLAR